MKGADGRRGEREGKVGGRGVERRRGERGGGGEQGGDLGEKGLPRKFLRDGSRGVDTGCRGEIAKPYTQGDTESPNRFLSTNM